MSNFKFKPSQWVPFKDTEVLKRVRKIGPEDFINRSHPNLTIKVKPDFDIWFDFMMDVFFRIKMFATLAQFLFH